MATLLTPSPAAPVPRRRNRLLLPALFIAAILLLVIFVPSLFVVNKLTEVDSRPLDTAAAPTIGAHWTDVSFPSRAVDIVLRGWLFQPDHLTGRSVIVVHGIKQNRVDPNYSGGAVPHDLLAHGYSVLVFDLRACGQSGGTRFTIANHEYQDVLGAYDFMRTVGGGTPFDPHKMAIIGNSMGAASTLLAAPYLADVGALVIDSAFADLRPVLEKKLPEQMPLPAFYTTPVFWVGPLFGLNGDLHPIDSVRRVPNRAFLFFHGTADTFIPADHSRLLRAASANLRSDLVLVAGAEHVQTYKTDPVAYMARVYRFFDQELAQ